jgi:hypothetical protein
MPSIDDVLRNREAYPDDREIDWFGEKTTLKDLRDRAMPKSDMTRMSQEWANRERQL